MTPQIPYDEMRRLCGLPDVRGYVARRELARMGEQIGEALKRAAIVWNEAPPTPVGLRSVRRSG